MKQFLFTRQIKEFAIRGLLLLIIVLFILSIGVPAKATTCLYTFEGTISWTITEIPGYVDEWEALMLGQEVSFTYAIDLDDWINSTVELVEYNDYFFASTEASGGSVSSVITPQTESTGDIQSWNGIYWNKFGWTPAVDWDYSDFNWVLGTTLAGCSYSSPAGDFSYDRGFEYYAELTEIRPLTTPVPEPCTSLLVVVGLTVIAGIRTKLTTSIRNGINGLITFSNMR